MSVADLARRRQLPPPDEARRIREAAHIASREMAAELGVHAVTFSRWERGAIKPRGRHAERWARALADLRDIATEG